MPSGPSSPPIGATPRVRIFTLGRFVIEQDGRPLRFDGKMPRRPLSVLKALIALGGHSVPVEQLCESVWPELDGDRAHSAFKSALSRLRKLTGTDSFLQEGQRLSVSAGACWVDAVAFAGHLRAALEALDERRPGGAATEMDAAIRLYGGPFLEGEFEPPEIIGAREKLHGQFTRHLGTVADALAEQGDAAAAIRLYRMGLEADDVAEDFCRGLMRCHLRAGNPAEALEAYRRFRQVLTARMGLEPSPELAALHAEIATQAELGADRQADPSTPVPLAGEEPPRAPAPDRAPQPVSEEGERRSITVLDVRVPGIADLMGQGDPEDAEAIVRGLREQVEAIVKEHGGVINQFLREEMIACFGVPLAREDHARSAAGAALEIARTLPEQALPRPFEAGMLACSVGIDTGLVVVKASGDSGGRYALTGAPMERAARLARQADPGTVLVTAEARRLIAPYFETALKPAVQSAGEAAAGATAPPYQVLHETAVRTRFDASTLRGLTEFVGRGRELGDLQAALDRAAAEQGQCVTVAGEAGIGKSRLVYQFCHQLHPGEYSVLQGRCQPSGEHTPYLPWVDMLRRWFELDFTAAPDEQAEQLVARTLAVDPGLERYVPLLLRLLSLRLERYDLPASLKGDDLRAAIREALAALLTVSAERNPVVLVLEDWHWADEASDGTLQYVLGLIASARILLIVTRRPEGAAAWPRISHHWQQSLQPLDDEESARVARRALGADELPQGMETLVHERTGGNPLFIEEMISNLLEEGTVRVHKGVATITSLAIEPRLPDTVEAVIRSRVDRLDAGAREVLQLASVAGPEFSLELLARVHPEPTQLAAGIERLKAQELIRQLRIVPEAVYHFNHAITQTVVYETLLRERRRELHALIGHAIEAAHADRLDEQAERLLHHYARAEQWSKAALYARRSGEKAQALSQFAQAVRFYDQGVAHLERMAEAGAGPDSRLARVDLQLEACFCRINLGQFAEAIAAGERIEPEVTALDDPARRVRLMVMFGTCAMYRGDREACERYLLPALEMRELQGDDLTLANCKHVLAGCYVGQGLWNLAAPYLEEAVAIYERLGLEEAYPYGYFALPYVVGCAQLGIVRAFQGHMAQATELFRKGMPVALGPAANFASLGVFLSWASVFSALVGDDRLNLQDTVENLRERAERSDSPFLRLAGRLFQSNLLIALGRTDDARALTQQTVEALGQTPMRTGHVANLHYNLLLTDLTRGDLEAAQAHMEAVRPLREISPYWFGPRVDMLEGVLADQLGQAEQAQSLLERSIAGDREAGAEVLADQTRYRLALVWLRAGQAERATTELKELAQRFAERTMPAWERLCKRALSRGGGRSGAQGRPRRARSS